MSHALTLVVVDHIGHSHVVAVEHIDFLVVHIGHNMGHVGDHIDQYKDLYCHTMDNLLDKNHNHVVAIYKIFFNLMTS